jgi:hypothetical protein
VDLKMIVEATDEQVCNLLDFALGRVEGETRLASMHGESNAGPVEMEREGRITARSYVALDHENKNVNRT